MTKKIYLDYAAATPIDSSVLVAMQPFWQEQFYNPSANSLPAKAVKKGLETARNQTAHILGARSSEIIFTAGGTEANNLAIFGVCNSVKPGHIVTSAIEHESVLAPVHQLASQGWKISQVKPDFSGLINVKNILKQINKKTVLVSVMYANNEVGTIQPIKQMTKAIHEIRKQRIKDGSSTPLYFHTDAAQATNYLDIHVNRLGVDLMTLNGGKIYGPKQSGILYAKTGVKLVPIIFGGGQERGLRSGTENVAGCVGFATALKLASEARGDEFKRQTELQSYFITLLSKQIPQAIINGSLKYRLPNNIHFTIPGADNERLLYGLEEKGIICASGSACSASSEDPSHMLIAMGITETDARASLRLSFGRDTTEADVDHFITSLKTLL